VTGASPGDASRPVTVVVPLPPSYRGGTEEYAYRLARDFATHAPTHILTTNVRWDPTETPIDVGSADVTRLRAFEVAQRPLLLGVGARRRLWANARGGRVLHLHMPFPLVESPAVRAAHRAGIPTVLTYHMDADLGAAEGGTGSSVVTGMYRRFSAHPALSQCDAVVSNSRGYAEASPVLSRHLSKMKVIRKGVDPVRLGIGVSAGGRTVPPTVSAMHLPEHEKRILFVGRLVPYKGLPILLEACSQLRRAGHHFTLMIAGRGPEKPLLESRIAALGLEECVRFLGFVPDEELGDLYRCSDLVVVSSVSTLESTATALEEAVALGVPVVGTDLPGTSENVPNDGVRGLLVPPGRVDDLATAMGRMLEVARPTPPTSIRTWNDVASDYLALFRELGVAI
jgi:1,4-alpha-glucan branching enzyme